MNKKARTLLLEVTVLVVIIACSFSAAVYAFEYKSMGRRDPFVPLVGVSQEGVPGGAMGVLTRDDVVVQGIVTGPNGMRSVIINGEIMTEGDSIGRLTVMKIGENVVTIKIDEDTFYVKLYEDK